MAVLYHTAGQAATGDDANERPQWNIRTAMRTDYHNDLGHPGIGATSDNGLRVNNLFFYVDGKLDRQFAFSFRQRLNHDNPNPAFMQSIDWAQLIWSPNEQWSFAAGKQIMEVGSMEYDANPIDVFRYSEWIQLAAAYQLGTSATRHLQNGDNITFQLAQSLCDANLGRYFSLNASWRRNPTGMWRPYYSVNMNQYSPHGWMAMIALGNRFYFGNYWFCLDWIQRSTLAHMADVGRPADNFTIIGCADWRITRQITLTVEGSYDRNTDDADDNLARIGTRLGVIGGGVLWLPFDEERCRFHLTANHSFGENPLGVLPVDAWQLNLGITWRFDIKKEY